METLKTLFKELELAIEKLNDKAQNGIGHVGSANYRDLEEEAESWVEEAKDEVDSIMHKIKLELNKPRRSGNKVLPLHPSEQLDIVFRDDDQKEEFPNGYYICCATAWQEADPAGKYKGYWCNTGRVEHVAKLSDL